MWDRSKQTYYISRSGLDWKVVDMKTNLIVCPVAQSNGMELVTKICFAETEDIVRELAKISLEEEAKYLEDHPYMNSIWLNDSYKED